MHTLQRLSVWGLIIGWLIIAAAAKTIRGDVAGLWLRMDLTLAIGIGVLLVSSIGAVLATLMDDRRTPLAHHSVPVHHSAAADLTPDEHLS